MPKTIHTNSSARTSTGSSYARFKQSNSRTRIESQAGGASTSRNTCKEITRVIGSSKPRNSFREKNSSGYKAAQILKWIKEMHGNDN